MEKGHDSKAALERFRSPPSDEIDIACDAELEDHPMLRKLQEYRQTVAHENKANPRGGRCHVCKR